MILSEKFVNRLKKLSGIKSIIESKDNVKVIQIKSKNDKSFKYDIFYDGNKNIFKVETQGQMPDIISNPPWFNLAIELGLGKVLDYNLLKDILSSIPELYVDDIN